jgi:hypothetical protein
MHRNFLQPNSEKPCNILMNATGSNLPQPCKYDNNGNLTQVGGTTHIYDYLSRSKFLVFPQQRL